MLQTTTYLLILFIIAASPGLLTSVSTSTSSTCEYSSLWGMNGEKWDPHGRLPDFSYAGYHAGESTIPEPSAKWDLKRDFHAAGDGHTDDSAALIKAVQSINRGVLFIPKGVYVIA